MAGLACDCALHQFSADHIEGLLASEPADAFAVSRKAAFHHIRSAIACQCVKHQSHRLLRSAASRSRNSGDADAEGCASAAADSFSQIHGYFAADRTVSFDQLRRNIRETCLQFIGVDHGAAKEIPGTAAD